MSTNIETYSTFQLQGRSKNIKTLQEMLEAEKGWKTDSKNLHLACLRMAAERHLMADPASLFVPLSLQR